MTEIGWLFDQASNSGGVVNMSHVEEFLLKEPYIFG